MRAFRGGHDQETGLRSWNREAAEAGRLGVPEATAPEVLDADDGFGQKWEKSYAIDLPADTDEAAAAKVWREHFDEFWPRGNRVFRPHRRLHRGDVAQADLELPAGARLATGLVVVRTEATSFALATVLGHMLAGTIEFRVGREGPTVRARVTTVMRAADPLYEAGLIAGGHRYEDHFWKETLTAFAGCFGGETTVVRRRVRRLDGCRRWRNWRNIRRNAFLRTTAWRVADLARRVAGRRGGRRRSART